MLKLNTPELAIFYVSTSKSQDFTQSVWRSSQLLPWCTWDFSWYFMNHKRWLDFLCHTVGLPLDLPHWELRSKTRWCDREVRIISSKTGDMSMLEPLRSCGPLLPCLCSRVEKVECVPSVLWPCLIGSCDTCYSKVNQWHPSALWGAMGPYLGYKDPSFCIKGRTPSWNMHHVSYKTNTSLADIDSNL